MKKHLTLQEKVKIVCLFKYEGWTISRLAYFFEVHHSTIQYYTEGISRAVPLPPKQKTYKQILAESRARENHYL